MLLVIPLENKPTWYNPPWLTVVLILINMVIFWGPQSREEALQNRAITYYVDISSLPQWELPYFVQHLENKLKKAATKRTAQDELLEQVLTHWKDAQDSEDPEESKALQTFLVHTMLDDDKFMQRLRQQELITPEHPHFEQWQVERRYFENKLPQPFTRLWALNAKADESLRPITFLTSAFLHGSTGHLLGNMLFLFMFGFTLELTLGRALYLTFYLLCAVGGSVLFHFAHLSLTGGMGLGASGAVSGLMAMYVMLYKLRRIRYFYWILVFFNYVKAPAWFLLPAWIALELMQHLSGNTGVGHMAHIGGFITGAALMWLVPYARKAEPVKGEDPKKAAFTHHVKHAQALDRDMQPERAVIHWQKASQLQPHNQDVLRAWLFCAQAQPASESFHVAAKTILRLRSITPPTLELQLTCFKLYARSAQPRMLLRHADMVSLIPRFAKTQNFDEADQLCHLLIAHTQDNSPDLPASITALQICTQCELEHNEPRRARQWLQALQRWTPEHPLTQRLKTQEVAL